MMTISRALGSAQAKDYYRAEYTNAQESYDLEGEAVSGEWAGTLAEEWGLQGTVEREHFERLADGQDPTTGAQLVRHVRSVVYLNEYGKEVKRSAHRAGWDATFSAPKSISLAALVGRDKRLLKAHRAAVKESLKALERYTFARMGKNHPAHLTKKFIAATFEHSTARPDRQTNYAAPQLHTHAVIFNLTKTSEGTAKPLQPLELYRSQKYATALYRAALAEKLQQLGYEIEIEARTGAPEIKGFSHEYLQASSPRAQEVKNEALEMRERLAAEGISVKDSAGLRQAAARTDRLAKRFDRAAMHRRHQEMDEKFGRQSQLIVHAAQERGRVELSPEEIAGRAGEAVTLALHNQTERDGVADLRSLITDALRRGLGQTTYEAVQREIGRRKASGELVEIPMNMRQRNMRGRQKEVVMEAKTDAQVRKTEHASRSINDETEIERRLLLGEEMAARFRVQNALARDAALREQALARRYLVKDERLGVERDLSILDIDRRAQAIAARRSAEMKLISPGERAEMRAHFYAQELTVEAETTASITAAHQKAVDKSERTIKRRVHVYERASPKAAEVLDLYRAEGREFPAPLIRPEALNELHEEAYAQRDTAQIKEIEALRRVLPEELAAVRDVAAAGRLEAHALVATSDREGATERLKEFERSQHLQRREVEGEKWSLAEVDRSLNYQEHARMRYKAAKAAYRDRFITSLRQPLGASQLTRLRDGVEAAKLEAENAPAAIERLQSVRETVMKLNDEHGEALRTHVAELQEFSGTLLQIRDSERARRNDAGLPPVAPLLTERELERIAENAAKLRDPSLLRQHHQLSVARAGELSPETKIVSPERDAARAFAREQVAGIVHTESVERLAHFEAHRAHTSVAYRGADGELKTATLREIEPKTRGEQLMRYLTESETARFERAAVHAAIEERHRQLRVEGDRAARYYTAAREIAEAYIQELKLEAGAPELPQALYTPREISQLEISAARQEKAELSRVYEEIVRDAIREHRVALSHEVVQIQASEIETRKQTESYQVESERPDAGDDRRSEEFPAHKISITSVHQSLAQPTIHQQPPEDQGNNIGM